MNTKTMAEDKKDEPKVPKAGEPGYYSPPEDPDFSVTKPVSNEVRPKRVVEEAERIPGPQLPWQKAATTVVEPKDEAETDYESMTVVELKELAEKRGIEIHSDMLKADIIEALKKG
jgi:hypothetical protein